MTPSPPSGVRGDQPIGSDTLTRLATFGASYPLPRCGRGFRADHSTSWLAMTPMVWVPAVVQLLLNCELPVKVI
jgi:hypothetical protein